MKVLRILTLFVFIFCNFLNAEAQVCGPSKTKIYVRDIKGNFVDNVIIEFPDLDKSLPDFKEKWFQRTENAYTLYFADYKPYGQQKIKISAIGFETNFQTIKISEAQFQVFRLVLKREGTNDQVVFEELIPFWGEIKDKNNRAISRARVLLENANGERTEILTNEKGGYYLEVAEGKYDIQVIEATGYAAAKYENFEVSKRNNHLDAKLEVDENISDVITELICEPHKYLAKEFDCVLVTKNPNKEN